VSSYLINPNLGHPTILSIDKELKKYIFKTQLLFVSDIEDLNEFKNNINTRIKLVPILDYKSILKFLLEKSKKERIQKKSLIKKKKKRRFWSRKKEKKDYKKKDKTQIESDLARISEKLKNLKPRIYRGDHIFPKITEINRITTTSIHYLSFIKDRNIPQDYLIKLRVFGGSKFFYEVIIRFDLTDEIIEFLRYRNFVMLDIIVNNKDSESRTNFHSIVISKQDWKNFSIVHATDLHLAERNDKIYGIIKKWIKTYRKVKLNKFVRSLDRKFFLKFKRKKKAQLEKPLTRRLINPNNQFRKFIKIMNKRVFQNKLDLIVLTGDLVDFTLLSRIPIPSKNLRRFLEFDYNLSNWKIFKDIVLNLPQKQRIGVIKGEELLCPLYTVPGNHDYRPYAYDLKWAGMYKKIGLKSQEAVALNEISSAVPISAIVKSPLALRGYLSEINPFLDYFIKLGNNLLIFLNSGSDSFRHFRDLITGKPSLTGLSLKQIKFLENLLNYKFKEGDNIFLFLHGPPINTGSKRSIFKRLERTIGKNILTRIDEFKESILSKLGYKASQLRIDGKFNVKYGTISNNWEKLIRFCKDFCLLTLAGHTHALKEYRLSDPEKKTKVFVAPPFSLKKIENPAAIYYDIYSELYTSAQEIEKYGNFVVQTPALGLGGVKTPQLIGAYRVLIFRDGKISSFKVNYLNR